MSNHVKTYFLSPSWDYPPNGLLAIGNIILSPKRPVPPLYQASNEGGELVSGPHLTSYKNNVEWTRASSVAGKFGLWTKFLDLLGIKLDTNFSSEHNSGALFGLEDRDETGDNAPGFLTLDLDDV
ncbi:unnamed protein product [Discula destructiva]